MSLAKREGEWIPLAINCVWILVAQIVEFELSWRREMHLSLGRDCI